MEKFVRYLFVGGTATALDFGLLFLLVKQFGVQWFPAAAASFVAAVGLNYVLCVSMVFDSGVRFSRRHEVLLVFVVSAVGLMLNQSVLYACIEIFGWTLFPAKVLATVLVLFWNFFGRHGFVFKETRSETTDAVNR